MFLATKFGWAAIALTLLTTGILVQGFSRNGRGSGSSKEGVAGFIVQHEIKKMQETLRDKGHYQGEADGVLGLRTRASIKAYQKAENLPITGQVDIRTADRLGVRPESKWSDSKTDPQEIGYGGARAGGEIKSNKPSAGIRRAEGRARKTLRKEVSTATAVEDNRGEGANKQQAENE
jgi:peptidoglycan hydrolase-like protein with peptidoglycan-binding domain